MSRTFAAIAALTFILASSAASAQMLKTADTPKGKTFVDAKGMTLYTFDKDAGGKSMCNGPAPELAAARSHRRRQADRRYDHRGPGRRQEDVGL